MRENVHQEYGGEATGRSLAVLRKLAGLLRPWPARYRIVGGWLPYLLGRPHGWLGQHVGSLDNDVLLLPDLPRETEYRPLVEALLEWGFRQDRDCAFRWYADKCKVELLAPDRIGIERGTLETVLGAQASQLPGLGLATANPVEAAIPPGPVWRGTTSGEIRVPCASAGAALLMKSLAFQDRKARTEGNSPYKDAYDMVYLVAGYRGGPDLLRTEVEALHRLHRFHEALDRLREHFSSPEADGPVYAARFLDPPWGERTLLLWQMVDGFLRGIP